jgi:hypothetical protein
MKVAEAAYRFGERGIIDYLDAQRVLRNTRVDFLNARYELQAALIEIERLRATPLMTNSRSESSSLSPQPSPACGRESDCSLSLPGRGVGRGSREPGTIKIGEKS